MSSAQPPALSSGMTTPTAHILTGDCIELMRALPDNSVDSIVTDPPYGLGFMGKAWDSLPPGPEFAAEAFRVLKPGGHMLAFGGTRTWHRLAVAVEDAGFEIRDSIAWLYGSGFPKSMDVSKAIDKARKEDREPTRVVCRAVRSAMEARGLVSRDLVVYFDNCHPRLVDHWAARDTDSQPSLPTPEQWAVLRDVLGITDPDLDAEVARLNARKGTPGASWDAREQTGTVAEWENRTNYALTSRDGIARDRATSGTDAQAWEGWGTALKPAFEPIVVARKPLEGTVAANVLKYGTGALNIDATRVGDGSGSRPRIDEASQETRYTDQGGTDFAAKPGVRGGSPSGRFPANVMLDESQAAALDAQTGTLKSGSRAAGTYRGLGYMGSDATDYPAVAGDSGGASRFFYVAKAPKRERPIVDGVAHATVKPLALMRQLVRLVTPPGGLILEPFAGSGTTVEAALLEGFDVLAMENEPTYVPLIEARIARALGANAPVDEVRASA